MARPTISYRAVQRNMIRPGGGLSPRDICSLKAAAREMERAARRQAKASKKAAA